MSDDVLGAVYFVCPDTPTKITVRINGEKIAEMTGARFEEAQRAVQEYINTTRPVGIPITATWSAANPADRYVWAWPSKRQPKPTPKQYRLKGRSAGSKRRNKGKR